MLLRHKYYDIVVCSLLEMVLGGPTVVWLLAPRQCSLFTGRAGDSPTENVESAGGQCVWEGGIPMSQFVFLY